MVFIPYRVDVELSRLPLFTLAVCALCVWVFVQQERSARAYKATLTRYCNEAITRDERLLLRYLQPTPSHYCDVLLEIRDAPDRLTAIRRMAASAHPVPFYRERADSETYIYNTLLQSLQRFERAIAPQLTDRLQYDPSSLNVWRMITAAFSHGSWWHLISNLIFFFAFAAATEVIVGHTYFIGFILLSAIGTHLAYRFSVSGTDMAVPTVGLSGVVMTMMAVLAVIMPALRIRTFCWFLVWIRIVRVPALVLATIYVVQNVFEYLERDPESDINYIAHLFGAVIGVMFGLVYRAKYREFLRELRKEQS